MATHVETGLPRHGCSGLISNALELVVGRNEEMLVLRHHIESFVEQHIGSELLVNDLVLIIDEALTNVFLHSFADGDESPQAIVRLYFERLDKALGRVSITITDNGSCGATFNPFSSVGDTVARRGEPDAGLGLQLILRVMDEVSYEVSTEGANRLEMHKYYLNRAPDPSYSVRLGVYLVQQQILSPQDLAVQLDLWQESPFADLGEWLLASRTDGPVKRRLRRAIVQARHLVEMLVAE